METTQQPPMTKDELIMAAYNFASGVVETLIDAKGNSRTPQDRNIAIAITDAQKLLAWIKTYCME
jgi:hypothetical protein